METLKKGRGYRKHVRRDDASTIARVMVVAANIKRARIAKGMSQRKLATAMGYDTSMGSYLESGRTLPSLLSIRKMAEILDIDPLELVP